MVGTTVVAPTEGEVVTTAEAAKMEDLVVQRVAVVVVEGLAGDALVVVDTEVVATTEDSAV